MIREPTRSLWVLIVLYRKTILENNSIETFLKFESPLNMHCESSNNKEASATQQNYKLDNCSMTAGWFYPGWALIDIQSFSALIQRFLRFQRCSELNQPTLILTSLVITDSVMSISEHLWFSAEHYWQAANRQRPWKKPTKSVFLSIMMLKRPEIENFRITFNGLFWKILKMWFFRNLHFLLIPCQKTSY